VPRVSTAVRQAFDEFTDDFDVIEAETGAWVQRLSNAQMSVKQGEARANSMRRNNVEFLVAITLAGLSIRVRHLAEAIITLINKGNPHAAPPVARALFETCCVPIYMQGELLPRVRKGRVEDVHKLVFRLSLGGIGIFGSPHIKPIKVDALIRSARSELTAMVARIPGEKKFNAAELVDIYYGPLSEFTHPNWGALSMSIELGLPPKFHASTAFDGAIMHAVASSTAYVMEAGGRAFDTVLGELSKLPMDLPDRDPLEDSTPT
jgi:hypothetical protein